MTAHKAKAENPLSVKIKSMCHPTDTPLALPAPHLAYILHRLKGWTFPRLVQPGFQLKQKTSSKGTSTGDISLLRRDPQGYPTTGTSMTYQHCNLMNTAQVGKPSNTLPQHCPSGIDQLTQARFKVSILHVLR